MRNRLLLSLLTIFSLAAARAEAPVGYYSTLTGKATSELKTALFQLINPHTEVSSYNSLPDYFAGRRGAPATDVRPGTNYWWDMYSDMNVSTSGTFGTYMNREHSLPKSWWGGMTNIPAYVDLYHLYPAEAKANQAKSNYPLGEIKAGATTIFDNGICRVGPGVNSGGASYVFEPANEYKGDFARTYFYMVTCYQNMNWKTTWQVMNGTYPSLQAWAVDLLLKWHRADPVSEKEINRNDAVYMTQNNRNPFIDHPELVEYIWGDKKGQAYVPSSTIDPSADAELYTPVNGMYIDFGEVAIGNSLTSRLIFRGKNVTGKFSLTKSGVNRSLFTLSTDEVAGTLANSESGTYVTITYKPTSIGEHSAQVNIMDGCIVGSYKVFLRATCLPKPTLPQLTATSPTNVTSNSYVARWEAPTEGDSVDYYMVTVQRYKNGVVTTTEYPAEVDSLEIDGLDEGDYDMYAVQSVRLEERSPMSNFITVKATSAIDEILSDEPLLVETHDGFIRFRCGNNHTSGRIYDLMGRTVAVIDEIYDGLELSLPTGAYFIVTDAHRRPLKIIAR